MRSGSRPETGSTAKQSSFDGCCWPVSWLPFVRFAVSRGFSSFPLSLRFVVTVWSSAPRAKSLRCAMANRLPEKAFALNLVGTSGLINDALFLRVIATSSRVWRELREQEIRRFARFEKTKEWSTCANSWTSSGKTQALEQYLDGRAEEGCGEDVG